MKYVILIIITIIICSCKTDSKNPINPTKVNIDEVQNNEIDKLFQNIDVKEINKKNKEQHRSIIARTSNATVLS